MTRTRFVLSLLLLVFVMSYALGESFSQNTPTTAPKPATSPLDQMVPMRDGVKLATSIYLPDGKGPWPAVLVRTPY